jgi:hypothetical protein
MENQDYSINDELPRTKFFQQFGEVASKQRFFQVLQADGNNPNSQRSFAIKDRGTAVQRYFEVGVTYKLFKSYTD